jgi:hypothetical protein
MHGACGVIDTACKMNFKKGKLAKLLCHARKLKMDAVSLTPDALCMQNLRHRVHNGRTIRFWQPLKGISIKNIYVRALLYPTTTKKYIKLRSYLTKTKNGD